MTARTITSCDVCGRDARTWRVALDVGRLSWQPDDRPPLRPTTRLAGMETMWVPRADLCRECEAGINGAIATWVEVALQGRTIDEAVAALREALELRLAGGEARPVPAASPAREVPR